MPATTPLRDREWFPDAVQRNKDGESIAVLADAYGVNHTSLRRAMQREGIRVFYPVGHPRTRKDALPGDRHLEKPLSLRLGPLREQTERRAAELGVPVRRFILDAIAEKLEHS